MRKSILGLAAVGILLAGCKGSTEPKNGPPANLVIFAGGGAAQAGVFGQPTPVAPTVLITDASNRPVSGVGVTFSLEAGGGTLNAPLQTTGENGTASVVWTMGTTFGNKTLTAASNGLTTVSFGAKTVAPATGVVAFHQVDPTGDTIVVTATSGPKAIDLLSTHGDFKSDSLIITATFSAPVVLATEVANALGGYLEIDIDDSPTTGFAAFVNGFGGTANVGVEYELDMFGLTPTTMELFSQGFVSQVAASVVGNTVVVRIPMGQLANDDGNFTIVGIIGTRDRPTDIFPNTGATTVRRAFDQTPTFNTINERQRASTGERPRSIRWRRASLTR